VPKSDHTTLFRFLRLNQFFPKGPQLDPPIDFVLALPSVAGLVSIVN
jgi:hypothetical protein